MAGPPNKGYKRSWKNLLINKRYQLRFTLFMVGLSALLMTGLGIWVMKEANDATTVSKNSYEGTACPTIPMIIAPQDDDSGVPMKLPGSTDDQGDGSAEAPAPKPAPSMVDPADVAKHSGNDDIILVENDWCLDHACHAERTQPLEVKHLHCDAYVKRKLADPAAVAALKAALIPVVKCEGGQSYSVADADAPEAPHHHIKVQIDESSMTMEPAPVEKRIAPPPPADYGERVAAHVTCTLNNSYKIYELEQNRRLILWMLVGTGLGLVIALAVYGIKMTHRVAGPLFKVSLYLAKMRDGRYDKVWNLRKGDQLVEFYEHFKTAHGGVVTAEQGDIDAIKSVIAAAQTAGLADSEAIKELTELVARKEKALE